MSPSSDDIFRDACWDFTILINKKATRLPMTIAVMTPVSAKKQIVWSMPLPNGLLQPRVRIPTPGITAPSTNPIQPAIPAKF